MRPGAAVYSSAVLVPIEDTHGAQRVPAAGPALPFVHLEVRPAAMDVLRPPPAVRVAILLDDFDGLRNALVGRAAGRAEVIEPAQDVVVIPVRERELEPARVDHLAG